MPYKWNHNINCLRSLNYYIQKKMYSKSHPCCCTNPKVFFLFVVEYCVILSIHNGMLIHLLVEGHLGCFQFFTTMDTAVIIIYIFISLSKYPGIGLVGHMVNTYLILEEAAKMFSKVATPFCFLKAMHKHFYCSVFSPTFHIISFS